MTNNQSITFAQRLHNARARLNKGKRYEKGKYPRTPDYWTWRKIGEKIGYSYRTLELWAGGREPAFKATKKDVLDKMRELGKKKKKKVNRNKES